MVSKPAADREAWILECLLLGPDRRHSAAASLVLGLLGPFLLAIISSAFCGILAASINSIGLDTSIFAAVLCFIFASGSYFAAMISLHLFASCQLPISIRLSMIYFTVYVCVSAIAWPSGQTPGAADVLWTASLCLGGFMLRWTRGWRALSWNQGVEKPRITIFSLMDATAAIAITMWLMSQDSRFFNPHSMLSSFLGMLVFTAIGLHVWARLISISPNTRHAGTGFGIWMAVNVLWAFLVFVGFAATFNSSPVGLLGFVAAPFSLLVAHVWTEIPLRWLRGCGWTMVRIDEVLT